MLWLTTVIDFYLNNTEENPMSHTVYLVFTDKSDSNNYVKFYDLP